MRTPLVRVTTQQLTRTPINASMYSMRMRSMASTVLPDDDADNEGLIEASIFQQACPPVNTVSMDGVSSTPFNDVIKTRLMEPITPNDVEIRPDGTLYLPEIKYRRILNAAIGPGGWVMIPRGAPTFHRDIVFREYALYCFGRFVSQAIGEQQVVERGMTAITAIESAKSNALMRCCKDLGVASELWDPEFINEWKSKYSTVVWCENMSSGKKQKLWRKHDREITYPWKETGPADTTSGYKSASSGASSNYTSSSSSSQYGGAQSTSPYSNTTSPTKSSSSSSTTPTSSVAATSTLANSDFDPSTVVPPSLRKANGRTWADLCTTNEGLEYLRWVANNFDPTSPGGAGAAAAIRWWESGNPVSPSSSIRR